MEFKMLVAGNHTYGDLNIQQLENETNVNQVMPKENVDRRLR